MSLSTDDIAGNLAAVRDALAAAENEAGRPRGAVTLIAVSKTKPEAAVRQALAAGHRVFGENRVQEAEEKFPALRRDYPDLELHLIGPLQSNKVKRAVTLCDVIQTLDREKLARAIAREAAAQGRRPRCFIQVNTGAEPQKAGILPGDVAGFTAFCRDELSLDLAGLMCIPPVDEEPAMHFALLRKLAGENGLAGLSMGMSADYGVAVGFGATHVRVGTAIFGARQAVA